jgi:dTDP-4-dehydrorhamnose 3,5-epimerase
VRLVPLDVAGAFAIDADAVRDERGWFARCWDAGVLADAGLVGRFVQQSAAWNLRAGTLRGLHLARPPAAEVKIVRCVRGAVFDVIVDARAGSPTFGRHAAIRLDDVTRRCVYVPAGCAHGYQTLVDATELTYDISEPYRAELAGGVAHDDPSLSIPWPMAVVELSARDSALPTLAGYVAALATEAVR